MKAFLQLRNKLHEKHLQLAGVNRQYSGLRLSLTNAHSSGLESSDLTGETHGR